MFADITGVADSLYKFGTGRGTYRRNIAAAHRSPCDEFN
jgi:hypothetical protein